MIPALLARLGTRPLARGAEPSAPNRWIETRQTVEIALPGGGVAHRAFAVTEWPIGAVGDRLTLALKPLRTGDWPILRWVWRVTPSPMALNGSLARKIRRLEHAVGDVPDESGPRRDEWVALQGLLALRDAMVFQGELLAEVDAVVVITSTPALLEDDVRLVVPMLQGLGLGLAPLPDDQIWACLRAWGAGPLPHRQGAWWQRLLGWHPEAPIWHPRVMSVARATGLVWPSRGHCGDDPDQGVYVGHTTELRPVFVDLHQAEAESAANVLVTGYTGSGKSTWMKTVIRGLLAQGWQVVVLDVDGEYRALCQAVGGAWLDVSGEQIGAYPDPLSIPPAIGDPALDARRWDRMVQTVGRLASILGQLDEPALAAVERAVAQAWAPFGVRPDDPASWDRPATDPRPTMLSVWEALRQAGDQEPEAATAAKRLWRYVQGSERHLFSGEPVVWTRPPQPFTVWYVGNLAQQMPGDQMPPGVAGRYLLVWSATWEWLRTLRRTGEWMAVVVDEGQRVLPQPILGQNVVDLATTIRKWNGVLLFATNKPDPLWTTTAGQGLWATTPIKALFRMERAQVEAATQALRMPQRVAERLLRLPDKQALLRHLDGIWSVVQVQLPPEELALYHTRGTA